MIFVKAKLLIRNFGKIISTFFEMLGIISLSKEFLEFLIPHVFDNNNFGHNLVITVLFISFVISVVKNRPKLKRTFNIRNRDVKLSIVVGDIFKQTGSKVIPTNTTFDTCMENEFISSNSIQGQFQKECFQYNLDLLDSLLKKGIDSSKFYKLIGDSRKTKRERYDCGTVSEINYDNTRYYFLAVADVSANGTPQAKYDNILIALQELWSFLSKNKHIDKLVIPLIGTGRAGIVDATRMRVIKDTIESFVAVTAGNKIKDELVICISPNDLKENKIDIEEVFEYADYISRYRYEQLDNKTIGEIIN